MASESITPNEDVSNPGGWSPSTGSTLYGVIDETEGSEDDGDYIDSGGSPSNAACTIGFSAPSDTIPLHGRLSYRYAKSGSRTIDITVQLQMGSQAVQTWEHLNVGTSYAQADQIIRAEIDDWSDIRVTFTANQSGGSGGPGHGLISFATIRTSVVKSIGTSKDYSTITSWESNLDNTTYPDALTVAEGQCYDEAFDESVTINSSASNLVTGVLTVAAGERHDGTEGTGARIVASAARSITLNSGMTEGILLNWLEIDANGQAAPDNGCVTLDSDSSRRDLASRLLIHGIRRVNYVRGIRYTGTGYADVLNCVCYDLGITGYTAAAVSGLQGSYAYSFRVLNCTIHDCWSTSSHASSNARGIAYIDGYDHEVRNCVATDSVANAGSATDFTPSSPSSAITQTNASSDSTAPSPIGAEPVVSSVEFVSNADPYDLHLDSGAECIDAGTDLGVSPAGVNLAIPVGDYTEGYDRDADPESVSPWDVGAAEYYSAANELTATLSEAVLTVQGPAVTAQYQAELSATLSEGAVGLQAPAVTASYQQPESATLAAAQLAVEAPAVSATGTNEQTASLMEAVLTVQSAAVTPQYIQQETASLAAAQLAMEAPGVTAQYQAELSATLAEAVLTVQAPPVTASAGNELTASLAVAQLGIEGLAVTASYIQQESASLAEAQLAMEAPAVTASSGNEQTATLTEAVLGLQAAPVTAQYVQVESASLTAAELVTQAPAVTAQYELFLSATLAEAVLSLDTPAITAEYQAELSASLAAAELAVEAPIVSADYVQAETASLAMAVLTIQGPAVTAQYLVTAFAFYVVAGRTFTSGAMAGKAYLAGTAAGRVFVPGANVGAIAA